MGRATTHQEFLIKAKKKHGDKYDYSKTLYKKGNEKVIIICPDHGEFLQKPSKHLSGDKGQGCYECGLRKLADIFRCDANQLIEKARLRYGNKYDYSQVSYKKQGQQVTIICPIHGEFLTSMHTHINGYECRYCKYGILESVDDFNSSDINQRYTNHSLDKRIRIANCFKRCRDTHGLTYEYDFDNFVDIVNKITIICPNHGRFFQTAHNHINHKQGCPECGRENTTKYAQDNPSGWNYTHWATAAQKSQWFDSYKVYVIKCFDVRESFYKIGKTFLSIDRRFNSMASMPYHWEIVKLIESADPKYISELEKKLQKENYINKYYPLREFSGSNECFKEILLTF